MKNCIVAFANFRGNYIKGMGRLSESLKTHFDGDFIGYVGESSIGAPDHSDNPYAFKIYCFLKALERGYTKILYVDCSVWAIRNVQPVFDLIEKDGYVMQEAGHHLKNWINNDALNYFGIQREAIEDVIMVGNAGFLGLDFSNPIATEFFDKWHKAMLAGAFKGSWADHRHDMSCSSMIAWLMCMTDKYVNGEQILEYAQFGSPPKNDSIIFQAAGM